MTKSSIVGHVIEVFVKFTTNTLIPADLTIRNFFAERKYLGAGDRRQISEAYFGTIKQFLRLEAITQDALKTKFNHPQLVVSAYYIAVQDADPIEMRDIIAGLNNNFARDYPPNVFQQMANRKIEDQRLAQLSPAERLAVYYSFPLWFVIEIEREYGLDQAELLLKSLNEEATTNLRANRTFITRDELQKTLAELGVESTQSTIAEDALILSKRMNVWDLAPFKQGLFEIQDEASQLVAPFANITSNKIRVLDACAGAGGKSLHFSSLLRGQGEIVATDIGARKLEEMRKRVKRSNIQNIRIVAPNQYDEQLGIQAFGSFDVVLLDVPCSGTGTLRRNPSIKWRLTEEMQRELIEKQRNIFERNAPYVKENGVLLYSTCSLLKSEGEQQAEWFVSRNPEFILEATKRTHPETEHCDGFFVARIRRSSTGA